MPPLPSAAAAAAAAPPTIFTSSTTALPAPSPAGASGLRAFQTLWRRRSARDRFYDLAFHSIWSLMDQAQETRIARRAMNNSTMEQSTLPAELDRQPTMAVGAGGGGVTNNNTTEVSQVSNGLSRTVSLNPDGTTGNFVSTARSGSLFPSSSESDPVLLRKRLDSNSQGTSGAASFVGGDASHLGGTRSFSVAGAAGSSGAPLTAVPSGIQLAPDIEKITREYAPNFRNDIFNMIEKREVVDFPIALKVISDAAKVLASRPVVHFISTPSNGQIVVVGDLHGQLKDLFYIMHTQGFPSPSKFFIFNGDFVDRGPYGVEVLLYVYTLLCAFPQYVFLNRGNHEDYKTNCEYGFQEEVQAKYDDFASDMMDAMAKSFKVMPIITVVDKRIAVLHGGIPRDTVTLERIGNIGKVRDVPTVEQQDQDEEILCDILWSDPVERYKSRQLGLRHQGDHWRSSSRGCGIEFLSAHTVAFLELNQLELVVRSHEVVPGGYEVRHEGRCATVFSASDYCGVSGNRGAIAVFSAMREDPVYHTWFVKHDILPTELDLEGSIQMPLNGTVSLLGEPGATVSFDMEDASPPTTITTSTSASSYGTRVAGAGGGAGGGGQPLFTSTNSTNEEMHHALISGANSGHNMAAGGTTGSMAGSVNPSTSASQHNNSHIPQQQQQPPSQHHRSSSPMTHFLPSTNTAIIARNPSEQVRHNVISEIRTQIWLNRYDLLSAFNSIDREQNGLISKVEWCEVVRKLFQLDLPWYFLCPFIVPRLLRFREVPSVPYAEFIAHVDSECCRRHSAPWIAFTIKEVFRKMELPDDLIPPSMEQSRQVKRRLSSLVEGPHVQAGSGTRLTQGLVGALGGGVGGGAHGGSKRQLKQDLFAGAVGNIQVPPPPPPVPSPTAIAPRGGGMQPASLASVPSPNAAATSSMMSTPIPLPPPPPPSMVTVVGSGAAAPPKTQHNQQFVVQPPPPRPTGDTAGGASAASPPRRNFTSGVVSSTAGGGDAALLPPGHSVSLMSNPMAFAAAAAGQLSSGEFAPEGTTTTTDAIDISSHWQPQARHLDQEGEDGGPTQRGGGGGVDLHSESTTMRPGNHALLASIPSTSSTSLLHPNASGAAAGGAGVVAQTTLCYSSASGTASTSVSTALPPQANGSSGAAATASTMLQVHTAGSSSGGGGGGGMRDGTSSLESTNAVSSPRPPPRRTETRGPNDLLVGPRITDGTQPTLPLPRTTTTGGATAAVVTSDPESSSYCSQPDHNPSHSNHNNNSSSSAQESYLYSHDHTTTHEAAPAPPPPPPPTAEALWGDDDDTEESAANLTPHRAQNSTQSNGSSVGGGGAAGVAIGNVTVGLPTLTRALDYRSSNVLPSHQNSTFGGGARGGILLHDPQTSNSGGGGGAAMAARRTSINSFSGPFSSTATGSLNSPSWRDFRCSFQYFVAMLRAKSSVAAQLEDDDFYILFRHFDQNMDGFVHLGELVDTVEALIDGDEAFSQAGSEVGSVRDAVTLHPGEGSSPADPFQQFGSTQKPSALQRGGGGGGGGGGGAAKSPTQPTMNFTTATATSGLHNKEKWLFPSLLALQRFFLQQRQRDLNIVFSLMDRDRDGALQKPEFNRAVSRVHRMLKRTADETQLEIMLQVLDQSEGRNGGLQLQDFLWNFSIRAFRPNRR